MSKRKNQHLCPTVDVTRYISSSLSVGSSSVPPLREPDSRMKRRMGGSRGMDSGGGKRRLVARRGEGGPPIHSLLSVCLRRRWQAKKSCSASRSLNLEQTRGALHPLRRCQTDKLINTTRTWAQYGSQSPYRRQTRANQRLLGPTHPTLPDPSISEESAQYQAEFVCFNNRTKVKSKTSPRLASILFSPLP